MRLLTVSTADVAQTFSRIVFALAKQSIDDVIIRFTPTHVHFFRSTNENPVMFRLKCVVERSQIFNDYKMQGFSEEANEMYLKVNINSLKTAIAHIERSTIMSIKLDGGTNYCGGPCIVIKLETQLAAVAQSRKVYQQVPITVIAHRRWSEFEEGDLPEADVLIDLPNPKKLSKLVDRLKFIDNTIDLIAVRELGSIVENKKTGTLNLISGRTVGGRVSSESRNVPMNIPHDLDGDLIDSLTGNFTCSVTVDVKLLQQFLSSFATINSTLKIEILKDQYLKLSMKQHELDAVLTLPNMGV